MGKNISDGEYTIEVSLSGGSGKSSIESPAKLNVDSGKMKAELRWSSSSYDYMKIGDSEYLPESTEGGSLFVVDIPELDSDIPVLAETVAMNSPHMIEYTLRFDSSSMEKQNGSPYGIIGVCVSVGVVLVAVTAIIAGRLNSHGKK